jgi:hypothetical protein
VRATRLMLDPISSLYLRNSYNPLNRVWRDRTMSVLRSIYLA